jgi:hypothetical protein
MTGGRAKAKGQSGSIIRGALPDCAVAAKFPAARCAHDAHLGPLGRLEGSLRTSPTEPRSDVPASLTFGETAVLHTDHAHVEEERMQLGAECLFSITPLPACCTPRPPPAARADSPGGRVASLGFRLQGLGLLTPHCSRGESEVSGEWQLG